MYTPTCRISTLRDFVVLFVLHRMTANNYSVRFSEICRPGGDVDLSIPIGKRPKLYRFLEILPGSLSYGVIILLGLLLIVNSVWAWIYMRTVILLISVYLGVTAYCMVKSGLALKRSLAIDWADRLASLENPKESWALLRSSGDSTTDCRQHLENLRLMAGDERDRFPRPSEIYNALIVPAYNEDIETIDAALRAVAGTAYDKKRLIVVFAYEERGGAAIKETALRLWRRYHKEFYSFHIVEHPKDAPGEVIGKGGNITHAGRWLKRYLEHLRISPANVIVTTMDCDNRPHKHYFSCLTYEYIVHEERERLSYQPVCLFTNNIWDAPAPTRVVAIGNSLYNIFKAAQLRMLRNFSSHAQPMEALLKMDFWSTRTIVEDGHQYWRSFFYYGGKYRVLPIYTPIYHDAVLTSNYIRTLRVQFVQLRRWAYGASDVAYVGYRLFPRKRRNCPFWTGLLQFAYLLGQQVARAALPIIVPLGGWALMLCGSETVLRVSERVPAVVNFLQNITMSGNVLISFFVSYKVLPPRPSYCERRRTLWMLLQWMLVPALLIFYGSLSAYVAQTHLIFGKYLDKFDVTEKTFKSV